MRNNWIEVSDLEDPASPYAEYAVDSASFLMWSMTGRKYNGLSTITEHYVCPEYETPTTCNWLSHSTFSDGGVIKHIAHVLGTGGRVKLPLRNAPVREIERVEVNGEEIPFESFYIESNKNLVFAEGVSSCSEIVVEYTYGVQPPSMGRLAATVLANNIAADLDGKECQLPSNVSSVSRQGVSFEIYDPQVFLSDGKVGIFIVDAFIAAANPTNSKKPTRIFSAEEPRGRTRRIY